MSLRDGFGISCSVPATISGSLRVCRLIVRQTQGIKSPVRRISQKRDQRLVPASVKYTVLDEFGTLPWLSHEEVESVLFVSR